MTWGSSSDLLLLDKHFLYENNLSIFVRIMLTQHLVTSVTYLQPSGTVHEVKTFEFKNTKTKTLC